jgi:hypothetical protein
MKAVNFTIKIYTCIYMKYVSLINRVCIGVTKGGLF